MLKELLDQSKSIPEARKLNPQEYLQKNAETFDALVNFLRDHRRFPNREINLAVTLMWRLIGQKEIPATLDQWGLPFLSLVVLGDYHQNIPLFIIPLDFLDQVRENTVMQLGMVANTASQVRDYYTGRITGDNSPEVNLRARAFESEALLSLQQMATQEGATITWNEWQQNILRKFPHGLASLPPRFKYPTPVYMTPARRN